MIFFAAGGAMICYFRYEKARMERKRIAEMSKGMGRPKIGGRFELIDQDGNTFRDENMKGRFSLVSGNGEAVLVQRDISEEG